jgi:hypothetical protein
MENITIFLGGSSVLAVIVVQLIKGFITGVIKPRWGALGVQIILFVVALIIATLGLWVKVLPENILATAGTIFATAMVIYEVLGKAIISEAIMGKTK